MYVHNWPIKIQKIDILKTPLSRIRFLLETFNFTPWAIDGYKKNKYVFICTHSISEIWQEWLIWILITN